MRPGGVGRRKLVSIRHGILTLIATFAVAAGQVTYRLGPTRTEGPVPATRLDGTARGRRTRSLDQAALGLLWLACSGGVSVRLSGYGSHGLCTTRSSILQRLYVRYRTDAKRLRV